MGLFSSRRTDTLRKLEEIGQELNIYNDTIALLQRNIDEYMHDIKTRTNDPLEAAVMLISAAITTSAENGGLATVRVRAPYVYDDLQRLWEFCGQMVEADERFEHVVIVGGIDGSPFKYAEERYRR